MIHNKPLGFSFSLLCVIFIAFKHLLSLHFCMCKSVIYLYIFSTVCKKITIVYITYIQCITIHYCELFLVLLYVVLRKSIQFEWVVNAPQHMENWT